MPPLAARSNQALVTNPFTSEDLSIKARRDSTRNRNHSPLGWSLQRSPPPPRENHSEMKISARRSKSRENTARHSATMLQNQRNRDPESESPPNESSTGTTKESEHFGYSMQTQHIALAHPYYPRREDSKSAKVAEQKKQSSIDAQRELQHTTGDPYARDAIGLDLLLQAAKVIEDRERAKQIQEQNMQLDVPVAGMPETASDHSDDNDERFKDASEFDWLSNTPPAVEIPTNTSSMLSRPRTLSPKPRSHKHRRSVRLPSTNPTNQELRPRPTIHRPAKRAQSAQVQDTLSSSATTSSVSSSSRRQNAIVQERIQAINDKAAANSQGTAKPNWDPLVKSYIEEQQAKKRKTMEWLAQQESSEEEGYDEGVEGGFWVESGNENESESTGSLGEAREQREEGAIDIDDRHNADAIDNIGNLDSDPITTLDALRGPAAENPGAERMVADEDDDEAETIILDPRPRRRRRLVRGHRSPADTDTD